MEKEICKDIFNRSKEIGLQYTDLLGEGDSKDYNEVKGIYSMCGKDGGRQRKVLNKHKGVTIPAEASG